MNASSLWSEEDWTDGAVLVLVGMAGMAGGSARLCSSQLTCTLARGGIIFCYSFNYARFIIFHGIILPKMLISTSPIRPFISASLLFHGCMIWYGEEM